MNSNIESDQNDDCSCRKCINACYSKPGIFASNQISELAAFLGLSIKDTFDKYLGIEYLHVDAVHAFLLAPAIKTMIPGNYYPGINFGPCVFLDETEKCTIHPVKPLECAIAHHSIKRNNHLFKRNQIIRSWIHKQNFVLGLKDITTGNTFSNIFFANMIKENLFISDLLTKYETDQISTEDVLIKLNNRGYAPNLINDDNNHWAITSDGMQPIPAEDNEPQDFSMIVIATKDYWKKTIKEALIYYLNSLSPLDE